MGDNTLAFDVPGGLKGRQCLALQALLGGDIGFVEREYVDGVARAIEVATAAGEHQCFASCVVGVGNAPLAAARRCKRPQGAPLTRCVSDFLEQSGGLRCSLARVFISPLPKLCFRQPKETDGFQQRMFALAGRSERLGGCGQCQPRAAHAYFHQSAKIQRLGQESRPAGAADLGEHVFGIGRSLIQFAHRNETGGAKIEQIEPIGVSQIAGREGARGKFDGARMLAGGSQFAYVFDGGGGGYHEPRHFGRAPCFFVALRNRHQPSEVSAALGRMTATADTIVDITNAGEHEPVGSLPQPPGLITVSVSRKLWSANGYVGSVSGSA